MSTQPAMISPLPPFAEPYTVKIDGGVATAEADLKHFVIKLHPLCFIAPTEVPMHLRAHGPHDPILDDPEFIEDMKEWVAEKSNCDPEELKNFEEVYRFHLRLWDKPKMLERMLQFAVAHEMGHLAHKHRHSSWESFFSLSLGLTLFCLASPFVYAFFVAIAASLLSHQVFRAIRQLSERHFEFEADKYALEYTDDIEAGEALLNCINEASIDKWRQKPFLGKLWTLITTPEKALPLTHPSPGARIDRLWTARV